MLGPQGHYVTHCHTGAASGTVEGDNYEIAWGGESEKGREKRVEKETGNETDPRGE